MDDIDIAQMAVLQEILNPEGIFLEVRDLESESVRKAFWQLYDKLNKLRIKHDPNNALTIKGYISKILENIKLPKKQKLLLLTLANKKGVERDTLIKKTKTKNWKSLKTLKNETDLTLKKYGLNKYMQVVGMRTPKAGYKLILNSDLIGVTLI